MSKEQCYPCAQNQLKFLLSRAFFTELSKEIRCKQTRDVVCAWFLGPRFLGPISVQLHQQEQHWQSEHGKGPWDGDTLTKPPLLSAGNKTRHLHCHICTDNPQQSQPVGFPLVDHLNHQSYRWGKEKCSFSPFASLLLPTSQPPPSPESIQSCRRRLTS